MPSCTSRRAASAAGPSTTRAPGSGMALGPTLRTRQPRSGRMPSDPVPTGTQTLCWKMQRNAATPKIWCNVDPYRHAAMQRVSSGPVHVALGSLCGRPSNVACTGRYIGNGATPNIWCNVDPYKRRRNASTGHNAAAANVMPENAICRAAPCKPPRSAGSHVLLSERDKA